MSEQKSPNVWNVGDTAYADLYDAGQREYVEREVEIFHFDVKSEMVGVTHRGHPHVKPLHKLRRQPSD